MPLFFLTLLSHLSKTKLSSKISFLSLFIACHYLSSKIIPLYVWTRSYKQPRCWRAWKGHWKSHDRKRIIVYVSSAHDLILPRITFHTSFSAQIDWLLSMSSYKSIIPTWKGRGRPTYLHFISFNNFDNGVDLLKV